MNKLINSKKFIVKYKKKWKLKLVSHLLFLIIFWEQWYPMKSCKSNGRKTPWKVHWKWKKWMQHTMDYLSILSNAKPPIAQPSNTNYSNAALPVPVLPPVPTPPSYNIMQESVVDIMIKSYNSYKELWCKQSRYYGELTEHMKLRSKLSIEIINSKFRYFCKYPSCAWGNKGFHGHPFFTNTFIFETTLSWSANLFPERVWITLIIAMKVIEKNHNLHNNYYYYDNSKGSNNKWHNIHVKDNARDIVSTMANSTNSNSFKNNDVVDGRYLNDVIL